MIKKLLLFFSFFFIVHKSFFTQVNAEVRIIAKIGNNVVTNIDVINEKKYLLALNKDIRNINEDNLLLIAKDSLFRETIKKLELQKYYKLNNKNPIFDNSIKQIYESIGYTSLNEFKKYLSSQNLKYDEIYKKIEIETLWNQFIYSNFNQKVIIDKKELEKKILENNKKNKKKLFRFSEILFSYEKKEQIDEIYNLILNDLKTKKFSEIVITYSISDSAKNSGLLDWVDISVLSENIIEKVKSLKIGELSKPILIPSGALVLYVSDIKDVNEKIDLNKELEKAITFELNNQLNNYSLIYFNKIKRKMIINEY